MLSLEAAYCPWIRTAGEALRPKPWSFPNRILTDYLMILVDEGSEWVEVGGEHHDLGPGDMYLLQPGVLTNKGCHAWSHPYWLHFDLMYNRHREAAPYAPCHQLSLSAERRRFLQPGPEDIFNCDLPLLIPGALLPRSGQLMRQIIELQRSSVQHKQLRARQLLAECLLLLVEHVQHHQPERTAAEKINDAERIARASLAADFDVAAFAAAAGLSPSRFHDVYKQMRGVTPLRFLTDIRMQRARDLLSDSDLSITSIAALVGHPDPTVFGRVFKREHGLSPRQWRDQQ